LACLFHVLARNLFASQRFVVSFDAALEDAAGTEKRDCNCRIGLIGRQTAHGKSDRPEESLEVFRLTKIPNIKMIAT